VENSRVQHSSRVKRTDRNENRATIAMITITDSIGCRTQYGALTLTNRQLAKSHFHSQALAQRLASPLSAQIRGAEMRKEEKETTQIRK
jgi:hypothetical protein